jgi:hypothetical protein
METSSSPSLSEASSDEETPSSTSIHLSTPAERAM